MLPNGFHKVPAGKVAMIVTYLEMRAPQYRDAPLPDGLEFAPLTTDVSQYKRLFQRVGQQWLWFGRMKTDEALLATILSDPAVHLFTLLKDGQAEAILELDFRIKGACELAYFGLTDALIGTGAGAYLMDRAIEKAFAADIERFHVHTCTIDSQQALGFYTRSGFKPVRQEVEIDDDPRITGVLPETAGAHVPIIRP